MTHVKGEIIILRKMMMMQLGEAKWVVMEAMRKSVRKMMVLMEGWRMCRWKDGGWVDERMENV